MASTGVDLPPKLSPALGGVQDDEKKIGGSIDASPESASIQVGGSGDHTQRRLKPRHIQLIGIGGTIGTALYVQIGKGLLNGGPASLFLAFTIWCSFIFAVTLSVAELVTYLPISSPFIRFAGRYVDEAFGFACGWNFSMLVPFEIVACNLIIHYWSDAVPAGGVIAIVIVLYGLTNILAVQWYGETEFFSALGKVLLIIALILFTFIAMLGGNPQGDRYGFRYWRDPGAFATLYYSGNLGRFLGFLQCLIQASFAVAGPDYVSMAAGEAENPRLVMPRAYNAVFYRLTTFFVLGALCVGINVPYNDAEMKAAFANSEPGAAASPYVVAMNRLGIKVFPDIVNAMVLTAAFSAGQSYVFCSSRSLYGMALEGKAPKFFRKCTRKGVPIYCVLFVLGIAMLSFLQVSENTADVLQWFVNLITASQLINFCAMCFTFVRFMKACTAQGLSRDSLPYKGWGQPYVAYYGMIGTFVMTFVGGYTVFLPGQWDTTSFFFSYTMVGVFPLLFIGWKIYHRTSVKKSDEVDLFENLDEIEEYERNYVETPPRNKFEKWVNWVFS